LAVDHTLIFFDVDGVLINGFHHNPKYRRMWSENIHNDLGMSQDHLANYFKIYWPDVIVGRADLYDTMTAHLAATGYTMSAQIIIDYWLKNDAVINAKTWEIAAHWATLPHTTLYLATNQEKTRADYLWNILNFKSIFKEIFYSGKMGMTKDNPQFFHTINDQLSIDLDQTRVIYWDDSPTCIASAQKAGWSETILVDTPDAVERGQLIIKNL
jgi:putative hydrolase of the HAD superfamily